MGERAQKQETTTHRSQPSSLHHHTVKKIASLILTDNHSSIVLSIPTEDHSVLID
jgi:hypothetical protein